MWADSKEASAPLLNPEAQMLKPLHGQGCSFYLKGWKRVGKGTEGQDWLPVWHGPSVVKHQSQPRNQGRGRGQWTILVLVFRDFL